MEKKRKKISEKTEAKPIQPIRVEARPLPKAAPVLNEKDRMILQDVEHIIWNPDLLKNLKDDKTKLPNGHAKKKPSLK
jgi:hypothetical protein